MSSIRSPKSFLALAEIVLKDNKNVPMTPKQIWEYATENSNEIDTSFTQGKTPSSTLSALLGQAVIQKKNNFSRTSKEGEYKYFVKKAIEDVNAVNEADIIIVTNTLKAKVRAIEESELDELDSSALPPKDILAFNEMRSCADIYRMVNTSQLEIHPHYQRSIVWNDKEQSRFVDSLMKSLPIPSMCISLDETTGHRQVIDGLQRIHTICRFLSDENWVISQIPDIEGKISGKEVKYIKDNEKKLYAAVENLMIPITVIRCDYQKDNHLKYLFIIFNRLNTGGKKLSNQEIRNCIYSGQFNEMLVSLKEYSIEKGIYKIDNSKPDRFEIEENILRFFAFEEHLMDYRGSLLSFLNDYMKIASKFNITNINIKKELFMNTVNFLHDTFPTIGEDNISKTVLEGILIGISKNINHLKSIETNQVILALKKLRDSQEYSLESLSEGLSTKDKVISRLQKAIEIFANA